MDQTNPEIDDITLVNMLQKGEEKGYSIFYDRHGSILYGTILKVVGSPDSANDVLQESFVKIWKNIHAFDARKGTLLTWAMRIARNTAIDFTRSKAFKPKSPLSESNISQQGSASQRINRIGVKEIVDKLKPDLKQIIDLIYFNGYTQAEVSQHLDLPLGTVKTRARIAMRELKKLVI